MKADDSIFPHPEFNADEVGFFVIPASAGISVRDHIAIQAVQGYLANPGSAEVENEHIARWGYMIADAMIAESEK